LAGLGTYGKAPAAPETAPHLRENGRICVMFCTFDGPPRTVRLHGRGTVVASGRPTADAACAR
jgi:hypothetical protein